jgi:hypothetical protein
MFYSFDAAAFSDPKSCRLKNGTTVFYNKAGLDCNCLAPIKADSDFGGPAVIVAFLAMGWITICVAAVPTIWSMAYVSPPLFTFYSSKGVRVFCVY